MRSEDAMEAYEGVSRRRNECTEPSQKLNGGHDTVGLPATRVLDAIGDAPVGEDAETLETQRRPCAVAQQSLAAIAVVGGDRYGGVNIEAARRTSTSRCKRSGK
jgi:hypothetical protein